MAFSTCISVGLSNTAAALVTVLLIFRLIVKRENSQWFETDYSILFKGIGIFFVAMTLSAIASGDFIFAWNKALFHFFYRPLPLLLVAIAIQRIKNIMAILTMVMISLMASDLLVIWKGFHGDFRAQGIAGGPMWMGSFLAILLPVLLVVVVNRDKFRKYHNGYCLIFAISLLALLFNGTRGVWLGMAIILPLIVMRYIRNWRKLLMLCVACILGIGIVYANSPMVSYKVHTIVDVKNAANIERSLMWESALHMAQDSPFFGVGLGNYSEAYQTKYIMEYSQQMDKQVLLMPSIYELFCSGLEIDKIDDMPFFRPQYLKLSLEQRSLKRILDILLSVSALLFLAPLFALTAIMIKIDNKGPVFYKQIRMGRYEKEFTVYKFRSMRHNAEKESGPVMAGEGDSRITAVGKFLRRTRIDEIPQFINVLLGDMSIVGPRPERPFFVRQFKKEIPEYIYRHNVKPGITGMAQVYGKYNTSAYDKLIYDLMYIQKCGVFLDFVIIIQTIRVLFMKSSTEGIKNTKTQAGLAQYKIKERQKIISNIKD